jgi:hypothetical protein
MNRIVYGALAGAIIVSTSSASENEWLSLDQEIEALSSSLSQTGGGPEWFGWIRSSWRDNSDVTQAATAPSASADDIQGFQFDSVRLGVTGAVGDYGYKLEYDFANNFGMVPGPLGGAGGVLDAYVHTTVGEQVTFQMGNFRQPFLRSSQLSRDSLLFLDRTGLGERFAVRQMGLMFSGSFETVDWFFSAQNGADGSGDNYVFTVRGEVDLLGGGVADVEGAYGATEETSLTAGLSIAEEGLIDDGLHFAVDGSLTSGPFSAAGEFVSFDEGEQGAPDLWGGAASPILSNFGLGGDVSDSTPWNVQASYMFTDMYEAGIRYEDADDAADSTAISLVVNRYVQGHDIKWQAQYTTVDSDVTAGVNPIGDIDWFGFGLTLSF